MQSKGVLNTNTIVQKFIKKYVRNQKCNLSRIFKRFVFVKTGLKTGFLKCFFEKNTRKSCKTRAFNSDP